ncbi:CRISPR-associated endonuclease Cas2 [Cyanobacterium stanieri LEGE 03274]|uniref:CRISPR-associated endoribonuclease Cas2 n=1 Tax=Cyanobacterium stanieri LEGE 03274 TaxID=1828756 RepID=A0ABR9V130_9CHRO|nr:CRISPR-associated endonuclease Cas2 [Cyanobacterium stanieri]MBE9221595.1 CRISPR-associated endonuclease Cas2 [Cyanobacterium stanieri LEGE 03274]
MIVIVYDIPDNKRRNSLSKFLEGYGNRVQFSVFECFLTLAETKELYIKIEKKVKPAEDNVRFYWISRHGTSKILTIGSQPPQPPPKSYIV